jgi:hypothetical protein
MLLKKKIILIHLCILNKNILKKKINCGTIYLLLINNLLTCYSMFHFINFYLKKNTKYLYHYYVKIIIPNWVIFNSILIFIWKLLHTLQISVQLYFNLTTIKNTYSTILRSTFKHKKSRDCFVKQNYTGFIQIKLCGANFFLISYVELIFDKIFHKWSKSNIILHRYIYKL